MHKHLRRMVGDGIRHFIRRQYGGQRHVSARYGLSYAHDVRFYTRMLPGKEFSRPSEARGYLIEYQQQAMFLAYLCRFTQVLGVVEPHAASALHHRFEDKRCQFLVMLLYQFPQFHRIPFIPFAVEARARLRHEIAHRQ